MDPLYGYPENWTNVTGICGPFPGWLYLPWKEALWPVSRSIDRKSQLVVQIWDVTLQTSLKRGLFFSEYRGRKAIEIRHRRILETRKRYNCQCFTTPLLLFYFSGYSSLTIQWSVCETPVWNEGECHKTHFLTIGDEEGRFPHLPTDTGTRVETMPLGNTT